SRRTRAPPGSTSSSSGPRTRWRRRAAGRAALRGSSRGRSTRPTSRAWRASSARPPPPGPAAPPPPPAASPPPPGPPPAPPPAAAEPAATLAAGWDLVAVGEGEATFVEIVAAIAAGGSPRVRGTAWRDDGGGVASGGAAPRRPLDDFPACNLRFGLWNALEITRGRLHPPPFPPTPLTLPAPL